MGRSKENKSRGTQPGDWTARLRSRAPPPGRTFLAETGSRPAEPNLDLSRPGRVPRKRSVQCTTYNTHKSGKPEKSESQKKTFPRILFLRIDGILPTAISGIWITFAGKGQFQAISQRVYAWNKDLISHLRHEQVHPVINSASG